MTAYARSAEVVEELVDYDGPQLLLLNSSRHKFMLAIAVRANGMDYPFFGCEVTDSIIDRYFDNEVDLLYVFRKAMAGKYYAFDYEKCSLSGQVPLKPAGELADDPLNWPNIGFFARSHTSNFKRHSKQGVSRLFSIDGKWEASDFSRFHGKMSDIYELFGVIENVGARNAAADREFLREAIVDRFWQGGGSYVGFYGSMGARNARYHRMPLGVDKIAYASPGQIVLRGNEKILNQIGSVVSAFQLNEKYLIDTYRKIYIYLKKDGLLSAGPDKGFSLDSAKEDVLKLSIDLSDIIAIGKGKEILSLCNDNVVVFAKIVLSIFRRAREIFAFYSEGRVQSTEFSELMLERER